MTIDAQQKAQRAYYAETARDYDQHISHSDCHQFALAWLSGVIKLLGIRSVLDIGAGTGRTLTTLKEWVPDLRIMGIEPSRELREVGYAKGLARDELIDGDVLGLEFENGSFDLVTEFATLHHVPDPRQAVSEMLRVAGVGIFLSDSNNFGQGNAIGRTVKQLIRAMGLWRAFDLARTGGRGYHVSTGDGLYYSYSIFDNYAQICKACPSVHVLNTLPAGKNLLASSPEVALLGLKSKLITSA